MSVIIVHGNPVSGFNHVGPFNTPDSAIGYMEHVLTDVGGDWWVIPLESPDTMDQPVPDTTADLAERVNWLHCNVQELQDRGVELPMGDYGDVYAIIEDAREALS